MRVTRSRSCPRPVGVYGLAATVYTDDPDHISAAAHLPAGVVWVNQ